MKIRLYFGTGLTAGVLLFASSLAVAQEAQVSGTKKSDASAAVTTPKEQSSPLASGRQDQFGHASGVAASTSVQPTSPSDAKKHIAGVKYEDRTATQTNTTQSGQLDEKGVQEDGRSTGPAGAAPSNAIAIKENGVSSKPTVKPHQ